MAITYFGQIGQLKKEKIDEYKALHAAPWPGVLKTIKECNLQNYHIYIRGDQVFAFYEYTGDDYEADMEKMAADPVTQEWWSHTKPCFVEVYVDMEEIFYLA